jgi:hypothetical protein
VKTAGQPREKGRYEGKRADEVEAQAFLALRVDPVGDGPQTVGAYGHPTSEKQAEDDIEAPRAVQRAGGHPASILSAYRLRSAAAASSESARSAQSIARLSDLQCFVRPLLRRKRGIGAEGISRDAPFAVRIVVVDHEPGLVSTNSLNLWSVFGVR